MNKRKAVLCAGLWLGLLGPVQAAGPGPDELGNLIDQFVKQKMAQLGKQSGVVINISGRQRMLTQKISKELLLVHLGVDVVQNRRNLGDSTILFSQTMTRLIKGDKAMNLPETTNEAILAQLKQVSITWQAFSRHILSALESAEVDRALVERVAEESLPLMAEMDKAVSMYEKDAGAERQALARAVNLAGLQRMLTQKMSKEFLLVAAGIDTEQNLANLADSIALFDRTLAGLRDGDAAQGLEATAEPKIRAQLDAVDASWRGFRSVLEQNDTSMAQVQRVAELNMPLLIEMERTVKMYEQLFENQ